MVGLEVRFISNFCPQGMQSTNNNAVYATSFSFGGPGGGFTRVRMNQPQRGPQEPADMSLKNLLRQLAPLLLLFFFTFMSAMPSLFSSPRVADPHFSFTPSVRYDQARQTGEHGIFYHVNGAEFAAHPIATDMASGSRNALERFERGIERAYTQNLYGLCQREMDRKERRKEQKSGFLGIGADWEAIRQIDAEKIESCEQLRKLGVIH